MLRKVFAPNAAAPRSSMPTLDVRGIEPLVDERWFDAAYYAQCCNRAYQRDDQWLAFFDRIAERIANDIQPETVLDAGCALGLLVETLRDRGIDAFGTDVSRFAIEHVHDPFKPFCVQASAAEPLQRRYDLIVSIEVLEHMSSADAEASIANFCAHTDDVLFSSSPNDFGEATHINLRPPEYWAAQFAKLGFYRDVDFDASFISPWAVRFRKRSEPVYRLALDYERLLSRLTIERTELRLKVLAMQTAIADLRESLGSAERGRVQSADTLAHMERSWFWRARKPWAWITRRLGRSN
jgi:2-polyprenyl-3-methyl-5-hydroxy-6-metoxy-1,4-benzoquinol methylase